MIRYCLGFAFDDLGSVALMQKNRPEWQRGLWNGIGGKLEEGELVIDSMRREFREETGVLVQDWDVVGRMSGPGFDISVLTTTHRDVRGVMQTTDELVCTFVPWKLPCNCIENVPAMIALCRIPKDQRPFFQLIYPYGKS